MRRSLAARSIALAAFSIAFAALSTAARAQDQSPPSPSSPSSPPPPPPPSALVGASDESAAPFERDTAIVVIGDDGNLDAQAIRALRGLAIGQLRKRHIPVLDDVRAEGRLTFESTQRLMREMHVGRAFSVKALGRLGSKIPLELEEIAADRPTPVYSATLISTSLEECDVVIPRLVNAVLDREPVEDNAEMATVTQQEARPFRKKPGEVRWGFGLAIPTFSGSDPQGSPFGLSTQVFYELEHFNVGIEALVASNHNLTAGGLFFQANWIPLDGEVSPYIGAGVGYMGADQNGGTGAKVQIGVEGLRLHRVRVMAGFEMMIPFFDSNISTVDGQNNGTSPRRVLPAFFVTFML